MDRLTAQSLNYILQRLFSFIHGPILAAIVFWLMSDALLGPPVRVTRAIRRVLSPALLGRLFVAYAIYEFMIGLGGLCLIIPGIVFAIWFCLELLTE